MRRRSTLYKLRVVPAYASRCLAASGARGHTPPESQSDSTDTTSRVVHPRKRSGVRGDGSGDEREWGSGRRSVSDALGSEHGEERTSLSPCHLPIEKVRPRLQIRRKAPRMILPDRAHDGGSRGLEREDTFD
ncbi:hypothetical protein B0H12DRAFT_1081696 [Mycena haematopus]|nr:hypothetical protein B0H12DRAFT_1081696 [Mycena haematopus]